MSKRDNQHIRVRAKADERICASESKRQERVGWKACKIYSNGSKRRLPNGQRLHWSPSPPSNRHIGRLYYPIVTRSATFLLRILRTGCSKATGTAWSTRCSVSQRSRTIPCGTTST